MTPGRKPSISASARATSSSAAAAPSFDFRSSVTERLPRIITSFQRSRFRPRPEDRRAVDEQHVGAHVGEHHAAERPGADGFEFEDLIPESGPMATLPAGQRAGSQ